MSILSDFRRLPSAFHQLVQALVAIVEVLGELVRMERDAGSALERIGDLELSRHQFEAECAGKLLQADGKLKAAANAEQRERQLKRSYERQLDPLDQDSEQGSEAGAILPIHAEASEAERLSAMRLDVAPSDKALAVRAKFGM